MIKKITALTLSLVMLFSVSSFGAEFTDVAQDGSEMSKAVAVLSELGIISGMGDGTFAPYNSLTRAQFAKMAVSIMGKTKEAVVKTDAFSDVRSTDWYSGYVNVVATEGIITGYPDGSFGANDPVTYAQAITILVRLLGFDATDVGHKWPQGYIDKAEVLGLTENMSFSANDVISRADASVVIYRALFTDMKGTKNALITAMDKNVYEDAIVIATKDENSALLVNQVQSDKGTFTYSSNVVPMDEYVGCEGTLVVNDESEVIAFVESDNMTKTEYTVSAVYSESNSDNISVITEDNETVLINSKTTVYMEGASYTAQKLTEGLNAGSTITLFNENGSLKHALVSPYKYEGPKTFLAGVSVDRLFNIKNKSELKVIRKGVSAQIDDIENYDVLYYSEKTNTIYAYSDRVTGIYEEAYPMKSNVSRVKVSGVEYALSSINAANKLNESANAFDIGDRVTLLFGENGDVVDAVNLTGEDYSTYGVILGTGEEMSEEGAMEYYVNFMHVDGNSVKYTVKDDRYEEKAGKLYSLDFEDSYAVFKAVSSSYVTGEVDRQAKLIGTAKLANDIYILEYLDGNAIAADVSSISLSEIDSFKLMKKDVNNVLYNAKGEICVMYLNDVTGNFKEYGIITDVREGQGEDSKDTFTIISGNTQYSYSGINASLSKGMGVSYYKGASGVAVEALTQVGDGNAINDITDNVLTIGSKKYTLSDDAVIYAGAFTTELKAISREDAEGISGRITLFADKALTSGGKVRVIRIYTA